MQLRHTLVVERYLATDKDIQNNAKTPDINFRAGISFCLQKLRCSEVKRTTESLEKALGRKGVAQAKVDNLDIASLADKNVFNFEITVDNAVAVAVVECTGNLATKLTRLLLLQATVRDDVVKHLTTVDVFKQHVPVVIGAHDISHTADVGVIDQSDNSGFTGGTHFFGMIGSFAILGIAMLVG